jgi:formate dehydrogenase subunit delta
MNSQKRVRMVNQIATFFAHEGADKAPLSVADHLQKFWEPRMRAQLLAAVASGEAQGLTPLARAAVAALTPTET